MSRLAAAIALMLFPAPALAEVDGMARDRLREAFKLAFGNECETRTQSFLDEAVFHAIGPAPGEDRARPRTIGIFLCARGAYNRTHAVLLDDGGIDVDALAFAEPELDVQMEERREENDDVLKRMAVRGFHGIRIVFNADFDPSTLTMTTGGKWRGLGDAAASATHVLRNGRFVLQTYQADPTFDRKINPLLLIEDGQVIEPRPLPNGN